MAKYWPTRQLAKIRSWGRLREVSSQGLKHAIYETLTTTLFASMPFWVLPVIGLAVLSPPWSSSEAFNRGEGFVYASALLGPLLYIITRRYGRFSFKSGEKEHNVGDLSLTFPYGAPFAVAITLICMISGTAFAFIIRAGEKDNGINSIDVKISSIIIMLVATLIFFLIAAFKNMLNDIERDPAAAIIGHQPIEEGEFYNAWKARKE